MTNWWWTDEELKKNWWWTDDELMITEYHRLQLTDWFYSIEHSNLSPGYYYIPDSTNYKSTASGANNYLHHNHLHHHVHQNHHQRFADSQVSSKTLISAICLQRLCKQAGKFPPHVIILITPDYRHHLLDHHSSRSFLSSSHWDQHIYQAIHVCATSNQDQKNQKKWK